MAKNYYNENFTTPTNPIFMPAWWQDALLLIPRLFCGYLLSSNFGAAKFGLPWSPAENNLGFFDVAFCFPNDVAEYGGIFKMFPVFFAWMGAFSEAVGGIFLLLGLQTRVFSFPILCTMLVASLIQHWGDSWNMLPALGFNWVALFTMIIGSGRFGIDYLISKNSTHEKVFNHFDKHADSVYQQLCTESV